MSRIAWNDEPHTMRGTLGGLQLFSIHYKSRRADPSWLMRCYLTGLDYEEWKDDDKNALKAKAEALLVEFVERLGAAFPSDAE